MSRQATAQLSNELRRRSSGHVLLWIARVADSVMSWSASRGRGRVSWMRFEQSRGRENFRASLLGMTHIVAEVLPRRVRNRSRAFRFAVSEPFSRSSSRDRAKLALPHDSAPSSFRSHASSLVPAPLFCAFRGGSSSPWRVRQCSVARGLALRAIASIGRSPGRCGRSRLLGCGRLFVGGFGRFWRFLFSGLDVYRRGKPWSGRERLGRRERRRAWLSCARLGAGLRL